jgi:hypothetical protein
MQQKASVNLNEWQVFRSLGLCTALLHSQKDLERQMRGTNATFTGGFRHFVSHYRHLKDHSSFDQRRAGQLL